MNESRSKKSARNVGVAFASKFLHIILSFLVRTFLIKNLGREILGLDGLFASVITVLNIADLGLGAAIIYSLYKPIAEGNERLIAAYISFFSRVYSTIGVFIMVMGFLTLPVLPFIVKLKQPVPHLEIIYLLTIAGTSVSYFFSSRRILFEADQRGYKNVSVDIIFNILLQLTQIAIILLLKSYIFVLVNRIIISFLKNVIIYIRGNREYKFLTTFRRERLGGREKRALWGNTGLILCHQVGGVLVTGVDNTIISAFVGTLYAGFYSNYLLIITNIASFITLGIHSLVPSVGNLRATTSDIEHHYCVFKQLLLVNYILSAFAGVMLYCELNNLIFIWIGRDYLLDSGIVLLLCINFYISTMRYACGVFNTAAGYFRQTVIKPIAEGFLNLIVSLVLVNKIGMFGVFLGTTVSLLLGSVWVDPFVLYKKWFKKNVAQYAVWYCEMAGFTGIMGLICYYAGSLYSPHSFIELIIHAALLSSLCAALTTLTTFALPGRKEVGKRVKRLFYQ